MNNIRYDNWKPMFVLVPTISFYSIKLSNERTYFIAIHWLFSSLSFKFNIKKTLIRVK